MFTSTFIIGFTFCLRREIGWSLRTLCSQMSEDKSCPISVVATATATFSGEDIIRPSYSAILCPDTHARHSEEETKLVSHPTWSSGVFFRLVSSDITHLLAALSFITFLVDTRFFEEFSWYHRFYVHGLNRFHEIMFAKVGGFLFLRALFQPCSSRSVYFEMSVSLH